MSDKQERKQEKRRQKSVKQIKFTAAFDGLTACDFDVFTQSKYASEDFAIPEIVLIKNVAVFRN